MSEMKKRLSLGTIVVRVLCIIMSVLAAILVCVNAFVLNAYPSFYEDAEREFAIPGIQDGFIPQDIDYDDEDGSWLFSGYVGANDPSPVYRLDADGTQARILVEDAQGMLYSDHGSAITSNESHVFLTCEGGYLVFDREAIANAQDGDIVRATQREDLDFSPAFMNIEDGLLFTGNFYHTDAYETDPMFHVSTAGGNTNRAVIYVYEPDQADATLFSSMATNAYSIPDRIQGVALKDGKLYLSQSYGLATSHILGFDLTEITEVQPFQTALGAVDMTILEEGEAFADIALPPMSEGIEMHGDRLFISFESASNKYIFGKLYGGGAVYSIPLG